MGASDRRQDTSSEAFPPYTALRIPEAFEKPCAMMNRQDLDLIWKEPIDDPVTLNDDFANVVSTDLRHNPT